MPAAKKPRASRARKTSATPRAPQNADTPINGVLIEVHRNGTDLGIQVRVLGTVVATEAQSLMELGIKNVRESLGLSEK